MSDEPQPAAQAPRKLDLLSRVLIALVGVPFALLGWLAIATERHSGSTKRGPVYFEGDPAVAMGLVLLVLGLLPTAILMPNSRAVKVWIVVWVALFAAALWRLFTAS